MTPGMVCHGMTSLGMKTERKRTELSAIIFVFTFFCRGGNEYRNPEMNTETDTIENGHGANTMQIRKQK